MPRSLLIAVPLLFAALLFARPAVPEPKVTIQAEHPDQFPEIARLLQTKTVKVNGGLKETNLKQLLNNLEDQCERKIRFVVREDLFRATGPDGENILEKQFYSDANLSGLALHEFLRVALYEIRASYLVRKNHIEITTQEAVTGRLGILDPEIVNEDLQPILLNVPLVNADCKDKSLADVLAEWEKVYDHTISVSGYADITAKNAVVARLMNVPLPVAVELLAAKLQLVAVQKDGVILVTTEDHAKTLGWKRLGQSLVFLKRSEL
ncbi:MAG: hypothetical protein ABGY75_15615 [Gemmataceae bacterium]